MGTLSSVSASDLGGIAIEGLLKKTKLDASEVEKVFMGQVVQAGSGQAPAKQASLKGGLSTHVPCVTINKVCGSGLESVILAAQAIKAGDNNLCLGGGMENMSQAPHLIINSRTGNKFGELKTRDSMQWDGLWDSFNDQAMGVCAERCVDKYNFSREELDDLSIESFKRSQSAQEQGVFESEITPVEIKGRKGSITVAEDEGPKKAKFDKIPTFALLFEKTGKITAANSSTINDGAAAILVGGEKYKDIAEFKIISYASHSQEPLWFSTAPVESAKKCLQKAGMELNQIDLFEVNEAFAAVALAYIKELKLNKASKHLWLWNKSWASNRNVWHKDFNVIDDWSKERK